jgi:hypothetical protein
MNAENVCSVGEFCPVIGDLAHTDVNDYNEFVK